MSKYEEYIMNILKEAGVKFYKEKTFKDLKNGKFRFDFYLTELKCIIEVDGEGHFKRIPKFHRSQSDFTKAQGHDRQKNSYCLANKIPLYRIPFWEISNIKSISDILQKDFLVKTRWHNDELWREYQGRK